MIDLQNARVVERVGGDVGDEIGGACAVGRRPEFEQGFRDGVGHRGTLCVGGNARGAYGRVYLAEALPGPENERLVLADGSAESGAVLVAVQRVLGALELIGKEIGRIEVGVAQVLEDGAVELVSAALGHDTHLGAMAAAELGGGHTGLYGELLHRIGDAEIAQRGPDLRIDITDAVQQEVIGLRPRAGDVESPALLPGLRRHGARREQREIEILPRVQRHVGDGARIDHAADRALIAFEQRSHRLYHDALRHVAHFERHLDVRHLVHLNHDGGNRGALESGVLSGQRIIRRRELQKLKFTAGVSDCAEPRIRVGIRQSKFDARDQCPRWIFHNTGDAAYRRGQKESAGEKQRRNGVTDCVFACETPRPDLRLVNWSLRLGIGITIHPNNRG